MLEISTFISKNLLSLQSASILGKIENVYFSPQIKNLAYFSVRANDNSTKYVKFESISHFDDALTIKEDSCLLQNVQLQELVSPLNMPIYTQNGAYRGDVQRVEIFKNGVVFKIYSSSFQFARTNIASVGSVILLKVPPKKSKTLSVEQSIEQSMAHSIEQALGQSLEQTIEQSTQIDARQNDVTPFVSGDSAKTTPLIDSANATENPSLPAQDNSFDKSNTEPKIFASLQSAPMAIVFDEKEPKLSMSAFQALVGSQLHLDQNDAHTPSRIICNYDFLLGRTLEKDLTTYTNELIAEKGSIVTPQVLQRARRAGKLVELTIYSRGEV